MNIIELNNDYYQEWDAFCFKSEDAWFWHTTSWLEYCILYGSIKYETKNMSFFFKDDTGVLAICPLLLEKKQNLGNCEVYEFSTSGSGGYGASPAFRSDLNEDRRDKIQKLILSHLDNLADQNRSTRALFRISPVISNGGQYNWLLKYGFLDASLNTQIIDLSLPVDALWSSLRKGHKYDVNRGKKYYEVEIFNSENANKDIFEQYRLLHHKAAGRMTRPIETFEMMYRWIQTGKGMLCGVKRNGRYVGFSYINLYKDKGFYSSASDDPEFITNIPISHVIQWSVISWLKEHGYKRYEIGAQQLGQQIFDLANQKEQSISFFKRGFGGNTVTLYRGVKYYNKELMVSELQENLNKLIEAYSEETILPKGED